MLGKFILWLSAILFIGYGIACILNPALPAASAGLSIENGDGFAEMASMYGGLQTGFGIWCLLGALRPDLYRAVLTSLVLVVGLLATGRLYGSLVGDGELTAYTWGAMGYEYFTAILAFVALRKAS